MKIKHCKKILAFTLIGNQMFFCSLVYAAEKGKGKKPKITVIPEVVVTAKKIIRPAMQASETVYTGSEITAKGMEIMGTKAKTSVYEAMSVLPGINVENPDANGLGAEQGSIRIRGVRCRLGALTVEGVPNYGGNPIGPRDYLYDMENIHAISVYKGAIPGDIGTGVGSRGGAIELKPDWPHEDFGIRFNQGFGTNNYSRTFIRLDSGKISGADTGFAGSYSYTDADKWRGPGELGPRHNASFFLYQPLGEKFGAKLWFNHNDLNQHLYRPLSRSEIQNLDANYDHDFNERLTGVTAQDIKYYDYNRGDYRNDDLISILSFHPKETLDFTFKPYYSREDTKILQGTARAGGMVQKRNRDIERIGLIGEATTELLGIKAVIGYHFESSDMNIFSEKYAIIPSGLDYRGYGLFAAGGTNYINSPFLKLAGNNGPLDWQGGLKYFNFKDSASKGYTTGPAPDYSLGRATDLDRESRTYDIWLPTLGVAYTFSASFQVHGSYGRNFIRPYAYMPLINIYSANRALFQSKGITLQDLFNGYDIEKSDTFDLGLRYIGKWFEIAPAFFYGRHRNLLTTIYDPRVDKSYQQNIGKATGYGLDMEMNAYLGKNVTFFINPTYTVLTYDEDLTCQGQRLAAEGNQIVDTPQWLVKAGIIYQAGNFEFMPMLRYIGTRYSDVEHKDSGKISSYTVVDFKINYTVEDVFMAKTMKLSLELNNIFDEKYISVINAFDDVREGVATYYPGAPFSAMINLSLQF